jgi:internalin A
VAGGIFTEANNPPSLALQSNPLLADVCDTQIPALETRGVTVTHDPCVPPVTVPDVTGMTLSGSATALTDAGLTMGGITESFSDTVPAGLVIRTNPAAGSLVSPGSAVTRVLSVGPATAVPDVVGMTQAAAETALTGAGLAVGTVTEDYSETVPAGGVISQNPAAGADAAAGSAVDLVVSLGSAPVSMPDANLAAAVRVALGLAAGTPLTRAHLLTLTSLDADSAGIADLTGLEHAVNLASLSLADNQIADVAPVADLAVLAALDLSTNEITTVEPLAAGTAFTGAASPVLSLQGNPLLTESCDTHIPALEARGVTVTHDACITPVAVPDLAGMTQSGAESALTGAGLVLGAVTESFSSTVPAGQVVSQNPAAGAGVAPGSAVNLVLSKGPSVFVPDVTWMLEATAGSALTGAGLVVGAVTQSNSDTVPAGQVVSQNPAAGVEVATGSAVDFVVSLGSAPVNVPDAALAAAIREQLGLAADTPLTGAHLLALTSLNGNNKGIADLTGLEHALNLSGLYLANDTVTDLTPLAGLTGLITLGLYNNPITDLTPLAGLVNMVELYLQSNQVTDVAPLSGMTALLVLDLGDNQVADVSPLSGMTALAVLYLFGNQIVDVAPLAGLTSLTTLSLYDNQIVDVAPLAGLTGLVTLQLHVNQIVDLAPLAGLANLAFLGLSQNQITDASPLAGLTKLANLHLSSNQLTTVASLVAGTIFTGAATPAELNLSANPLLADACDTQIPALETRGVTVTHDACGVPVFVPDVAGLVRSAAETAISDAGLNVGVVTESASETVPAGRVISQNPAAGGVVPAGWGVDIEVSLGPALVTMPDANLAAAVRAALGLAADTPLTGAHLLALTSLSADSSSIADLTGLEHAANLSYLRLGNNQITDLSPLDGLTAISFLVMYQNQITDLSPLAGMTAMNTLNIHSNQISDLTPLAGLVNMKEMMFDNNQIADLSPLSGLTGPDAALYLSSNPLSADACGTQIPALQAAGVTVTSDCL